MSSEQLTLFDAPPTKAVRAVGPAPPDPLAVELGDRLPTGLRLGTSSWTFPGWAGLVYDRPVTERVLAYEGLEAYGRHPLLRTVGLDRSFYAPIDETVFARYAAAVPSSFEFVVKAHVWLTLGPRFPNHPRFGEHRGRPNPFFLDPAYALREVIEPAVRGLGRSLGAILFQFPPLDLSSVGYRKGFAALVRAFAEALPRGPRYAFELRNHQLLTPDYVAGLRSVGAVHCLSSHPNMHELHHQLRLADPARDPFALARWMLGHQRRYDEAKAAFAPFDQLVEPDARTRSSLVELVERSVDKPTFVIVNNKAEGSAPLSIHKLAEAVVRGRG